MCEGQRSVPGVFLSCSPSWFLRQSFSVNLELADWLGWLASEPGGSSRLDLFSCIKVSSLTSRASVQRRGRGEPCALKGPVEERTPGFSHKVDFPEDSIINVMEDVPSV